MGRSMRQASGGLVVVRGISDRRIELSYSVPFITEESLVMIDRRENRERRHRNGGHAVERTPPMHFPKC